MTIHAEDLAPIELRRVAVIGAGAMGAGIAAHVANAGVPVLLLDTAADGPQDRDVRAKAGIARQLAAGGFMHPDLASLVETGTVEEDLAAIADCDWIVEAVFEDIEVKKALYRRIEALRQDRSIISSNTSTIPLAQLIDGIGDRFAGDFVITHFFNPPRLMPLLELVGGRATHADTLVRAKAICERNLGKTVVTCNDTPGFIANRIGNYWMSLAAMEAFRQGLTVEEADAVMSAPFGIPRTGVFGLFDFVGLNLVPLVWGSFMQNLPDHDDHRRYDITNDPLFKTLLSRGLTGRAGPGGFYRRRQADGARTDEVFDFSLIDYRPRREPDMPELAEELGVLLAGEGRAGRYAWTVFSGLIVYCAKVAEEIAGSLADIDLAIRLGYNWRYGPFALADRVGARSIADRLEAEGSDVPSLLAQAARAGGFAALSGIGSGAAIPARSVAAIRRSGSPVAGNASASVWDLGDGVACLEIHTKMNACNSDVVAIVEEATALVARKFSALVVANDNPRAFSAGADLSAFIAYIQARDWEGLSTFVARGQRAWQALAEARFPVVAALRGLALGGGAELAMHATRVVAHAEAQFGLPERNVGILPGWGGCYQLLARASEIQADPVAAARAAFATIAVATPSRSALEARDMGFLRMCDPIVMNGSHVLPTAVRLARELAATDTCSVHRRIVASGEAGRFAMHATIDEGVADGRYTAVDKGVLEVVAEVLSGGGAKEGDELDHAAVCRAELEGMMELARRPTTLARLEAMRSSNRPLRN
ncbi:3-hydroxyacyl-CoA dehydrogenase NAD-binding domain-containing protein [Sphingopyxis sp. CCNWLW253]|uniref:3-hydroxyacyl-CoA dehydrogenase/enoyl-CoA hydratase family protein n=1 Tax=unclassified Sphingopyxis TaxID=2614943 RepID=UPI003012B335